MIPSKHRLTITAVSGLMGSGLAVCAVVLVCGLRMEDTRKAADAIPAQLGHRWRPQQSREARVPQAGIREALEELHTSDRGRGEGDTFHTLLRGWAMDDPVSASAWAGQLSSDARRRIALETVAIAWAGVD